MIIYAVLAEESVGRMFLGGVIPGILAGVMLMIGWLMLLVAAFRRRR